MAKSYKDKEYLESLQSRAQKLLEISSQDDERAESFPKWGKSRRVDLEDILQKADWNRKEEQFEEIRRTDVELLRKCIELTSENSVLKNMVKKVQSDIEKLYEENKKYLNQHQTLRQEIANLEVENKQLKFELKQIMTESLGFEVTYKKGKSSRRKRQQENDPYETSRFNTDYRGKNENEMNEAQMMKEQYESLASELKQRFQNEISMVRESYENRIGQLEQRIKASSIKIEEGQRLLKKQTDKSHRLSKFISTEIPRLKQTITNLTAKVEYRVENMLISDFK